MFTLSSLHRTVVDTTPKPYHFFLRLRFRPRAWCPPVFSAGPATSGWTHTRLHYVPLGLELPDVCLPCHVLYIFRGLPSHVLDVNTEGRNPCGASLTSYVRGIYASRSRCLPRLVCYLAKMTITNHRGNQQIVLLWHQLSQTAQLQTLRHRALTALNGHYYVGVLLKTAEVCRCL